MASLSANKQDHGRRMTLHQWFTSSVFAASLAHITSYLRWTSRSRSPCRIGSSSVLSDVMVNEADYPPRVLTFASRLSASLSCAFPVRRGIREKLTPQVARALHGPVVYMAHGVPEFKSHLPHYGQLSAKVLSDRYYNVQLRTSLYHR